MKQSVLIWFDALKEHFDTVNAHIDRVHGKIEKDTASNGYRYPVGEIVTQMDTHTDGYAYSIQPVIAQSVAVFSDDFYTIPDSLLSECARIYDLAEKSKKHRKVFIPNSVQVACDDLAEQLTARGAKIKNLYYGETTSYRVVISIAVIYTAKKLGGGE